MAYPDYDVLAKRGTPSWNEKTRQVVAERVGLPDYPRFFSEMEWLTLRAVCDRIIPQPGTRAPVPTAAMVDAKMYEGRSDGYRDHRLPGMQEAWRRGLGALDAEARARYGIPFHAIEIDEQVSLLKAAQEGALVHAAWQGMRSDVFFAKRLLLDIAASYYSHPTAWNEIGFGGPASPRGYVRMDFDRRDPWEASEARPGREARAREENRHVGR